MAPIDFYYMPESPPCRAVEMTAAALGVSLNKLYINLFTKEHLDEEFIKKNPLHKVPFIIDGDLKLGESRAIMKYLVNKHKPNDEHFYPKDPERRAMVDELLFYDCGTLFPAQGTLLRPMVFGRVEKLNPEDEKAFRACLQYLDKRITDSGGEFMCGNQLSLADISLAASLSFAEACEYNMSEFSNLIAYLGRLKSHIPHYSEINEKPLENMANLIKSRQQPNP